jgi:hypothetical protein
MPLQVARFCTGSCKVYAFCRYFTQKIEAVCKKLYICKTKRYVTDNE